VTAIADRVYRFAYPIVIVLGLMLALYALLLGAETAGVVHTYSGQNAGVSVGVGCTGVGFEYRGNVGFFTDLCQ
jgi:hypothetical protein